MNLVKDITNSTIIDDSSVSDIQWLDSYIRIHRAYTSYLVKTAENMGCKNSLESIEIGLPNEGYVFNPLKGLRNLNSIKPDLVMTIPVFAKCFVPDYGLNTKFSYLKKMVKLARSENIQFIKMSPDVFLKLCGDWFDVNLKAATAFFDNKNDVEKYFSSQGTVTLWWNPERTSSYYHKRYERKVLPILHSISIDKKVLDAGAGFGRWSNYLEDIAKDLTILDLSSEMIRLAEGRHRSKRASLNGFSQTHFLLGSVRSIPLPSQSMDSVICLQTLMHVPRPQEALKEFFRVLKPGGILLIDISVKPNIKVDWIQKSPLTRIYAPNQIIEWLASIGFRPEPQLTCSERPGLEWLLVKAVKPWLG